MMRVDTAEIFMSYRGTGVQWAQWIAWQLEQAGFNVNYQAADFRAGPPVIACARP